MDSQSKMQRVRQGTDIDLISSLPESVLVHILSSLPTQTAVKTSILSKRWRMVWNSVPCFDFMFVNGYSDGDIARVQKFERFVDSVLILRCHQCIKRLCLCIFSSVPCRNLSIWIRAAIMNNVEELNVYISTEKLFDEIPQNLFNCETLRILKLRSASTFKIPETVCLPSLKVLHLLEFNDLTNEDVGKFLSGCPVLDEFKFSHGYCPFMTILHVQSLSLKSLKIRSYGDELQRIIVDTPKLEFLKLKCCLSKAYEIVKLSSRFEAIVHFMLFQNDNEYTSRMLQLLIKQISNVRTLSLVGCGDQFNFADSGISHATFQNLMHLDLRTIGNTWFGLLEVLGNSPNLQVVRFFEEYCYADDDDPEECFREPSVPPRFFSSLQRLEVHGFWGSELDMGGIKYILKNAKALKKLVIAFSDRVKEESKILKKLIKFPRESTACQVIVSRSLFF